MTQTTAQRMEAQEKISLGTHGENYGSWMSNPVFYAFGAMTAAAAILAVLFLTVFHVTVVGVILVIAALALAAMIVLCAWIRGQYSFSGGGIMQKVHRTVFAYLNYDGDGTLLDVGCGSGPMTIRAARTWPQTKAVGIDYYGKDFGYTVETCRQNARLEGVEDRCTFAQGDANQLDFADESMDAIVSAYVYHNIMGNKDKQALLLETLRVLKKGGSFSIIDSMAPERYGDMEAFAQKLRDMGYQDVRLIDANEMIYGSAAKAKLLMLGNAKLLVGTK